MKLLESLRAKLQNLKLRLSLKVWLKLLSHCEKLVSKLLQMMWQNQQPTSLHPRQSQIRALEDMSLSLPLVQTLVQEMLKAARS